MNDTHDFARILVSILGVVALAVSGGCDEISDLGVHSGSETIAVASEEGSEIARLEERVAQLESLAPGQGALMGQLGYHFGNLWFALDHENWPLAGFYLHECRETLEQAVLARPVRMLSTGTELNIQGIAEALDNTQFERLASAIVAKQKSSAASVYRETMDLCQSCHRAAEMPFLRVQIPAKPPSPAIIFNRTQGLED